MTEQATYYDIQTDMIRALTPEETEKLRKLRECHSGKTNPYDPAPPATDG